MAAPTVVVQHVTKASSDQLLNKFAELESKTPPPPPRKLQLAKVQSAVMGKKRSRRVASGLGARDVAVNAGGGIECLAPSSSRRRRRRNSTAEWKSLLPTSSRGPPTTSSSMRTADAVGIAFWLDKLERTWRKTIKGASKIFIEKHSNTHVRLISEVV